MTDVERPIASNDGVFMIARLRGESVVIIMSPNINDMSIIRRRATLGTKGTMGN
jgi:hypothetical protein